VIRWNWVEWIRILIVSSWKLNERSQELVGSQIQALDSSTDRLNLCRSISDFRWFKWTRSACISIKLSKNFSFKFLQYSLQASTIFPIKFSATVFPRIRAVAIWWLLTDLLSFSL
jgi:hypothetical protein